MFKRKENKKEITTMIQELARDVRELREDVLEVCEYQSEVIKALYEFNYERYKKRNRTSCDRRADEEHGRSDEG